MQLLSPAKINLFLRVLGKRSDGYHEIASLFQAVDLFDELSFEQASVDTFSCSKPIEGNLVLKAVDLFRKETGIQFPLRIHLEKHIPMEAGLGGGSSNAATTLYALNKLSGKPLSEAELASLGSKLGSDVPFFFSTGTAYCTGRGECFQNIIREPVEYTLCKPAFGSATSAVYGAFQPSSRSLLSPEELLDGFQRGCSVFVNDLEAAAFTVNPALKSFKDELLAGGFTDVIMSGSGSTFICKGKGDSGIAPFQRVVSSISRFTSDWWSFQFS